MIKGQITLAVLLILSSLPCFPAFAQETTEPAAGHQAAKADSDGMIKVLIVDGQNNHTDWPKTTVMMKQCLEETGKFSVDVARTATTWKGKLAKEFPLGDGKKYKDHKKPLADANYSPDFKSYHVVLSNFGNSAAAWPEETVANFEKYMAEGGGLVVVHAADNAWGDWVEFNKMIGLGGWGGRTDKVGPLVYFNKDEKEERDTKPGKVGDHGKQHEFQVVSRNLEHPIMKGLPKAWLHAKDELYQRLRGPAENMTILATAYADKKYKGTGRHEPVYMVLDYEKGRIFHTPLGHAGYSFECVGFQTMLIRGTEWAATGDVTMTEIPEDFPTDKASSSKTFEVKKTMKK